jgi:hypothetical protein
VKNKDPPKDYLSVFVVAALPDRKNKSLKTKRLLKPLGDSIRVFRKLVILAKLIYELYKIVAHH